MGQVRFNDLHQYYYAMGVLARPGYVELHWENNEEQGAWGSEGRIYCLKPENYYPPCFKFTAGRGNIYARINCNDYVRDLIVVHKFSKDTRSQNVNEIMKTIPSNYIGDFKLGNGQ